MMPSETKIDKAPRTEEDKKIDRSAEEAAVKAGKTEKRYDQNHDIFTK